MSFYYGKSVFVESFLVRTLLLLLVTHLNGCTGEIRAYDESYVPDSYLIKAWEAKGQWLLAEMFPYWLIIERQKSDIEQNFVEVHKRLLKERKVQAKALLDDMQ